MFGSLSLGRIAGIRIRVHWTCLLLLAVGLAVVGQPLELLGLLAIVGIAVLLHELGHGLVARAFGVKVIDITFWPLGGMARLENMPEEPVTEGVIALAGPLVNLCLAWLSGSIVVLAGLAQGAPGADPVGARALQFLVINLAMGLMNLLPSFPLDGGRILRSLLAARRGWPAATELAVRAGRWTALLLPVVLPLLDPGLLCPSLLVVAYLWIEGGRELAITRLRHGMGFAGPPPAWHAAAERTRPARDPERPADPGAPGRGKPRRPFLWRIDHLGSRTLTREDIEEIERYRGPLRDAPPAAE